MATTTTTVQGVQKYDRLHEFGFGFHMKLNKNFFWEKYHVFLSIAMSWFLL